MLDEIFYFDWYVFELGDEFDESSPTPVAGDGAGGSDGDVVGATRPAPEHDGYADGFISDNGSNSGGDDGADCDAAGRAEVV